MGVCNCSMFCCTLLYVHFSIAIILMGKRELIALLNLSSWCLVMVERLFLTVPLGCLQFVIVVFPDHTHLLFLMLILPQRMQQFSRYPLNSEDFAIPVTRTATYYNSLFPTALRDWNVLSLDIWNASTLNSFKHTLRNNQILVPNYFDTLHVSRIALVLHNRIRLECSSLNSHLFKENLIDNQLCSCGSIETTSHFFFSCPRYTAHRQLYLLNLSHELSVSLLLRGDPNQPCTVNNIILKHAQLYILATKRFL